MNESNFSNEKIVAQLIEELNFKSLKLAVSTLSKWLNLKESSVYNKLNGRSNFSIEELYIICQNSEISLDRLFRPSHKKSSFVPFYADGLRYKPRHFADYINNINGYYSKFKLLQNAHGYFLTNEVPMSHFIGFPRLMYLKMYIWNKFNWKIPNIGREYLPSDLNTNPEFTYALKLLDDNFNSFSSTEIWTPYMLDNTISQIKYLRNMELLTNTDEINGIKTELMNLIIHLEDLTNTGKKSKNFKNHEFECQIYISELSLGSEVILVKSDTDSMMFQQLDVPNYMHSKDQKLIQNQFDFFNNIKSLSIHITKSAEIEKNFFFKRMRDQLSKL